MLHAVKKFFQGKAEITANHIKCADADVHTSRFDPAEVNTGIKIKLFLCYRLLFAKGFDPVGNFLKQCLVFYLSHQEQAEKRLKNI
jgi:hypothetical protein